MIDRMFLGMMVLAGIAALVLILGLPGADDDDE